MRKFVVGTRNSSLARTQTNLIIDELRKARIENEIEVKEFVTTGDRNLNVSLAEVGGTGIFIQELEQALLDGEIDFAVHSMKDLEPIVQGGLVITAVPPREDHRDALIAGDGCTVERLKEGAIIGTSSLRRAAQIRSVRPDLQTKWIRGTVEARLQQLREGQFDAIILAVAGLKRLGLDEKYITEYLPEDVFVPAVGQGALAIECREDDYELRDVLERINDDHTLIATQAERHFEEVFAGENRAPVGAYAFVENDTITLHTTIISEDGTDVMLATAKGTNPEEVAQEAKKLLIAQGAQTILDAFEQKENMS